MKKKTKGTNLKLAPHFFENNGSSNFQENDQGAYHFILEKVVAPAQGGILRYYKDCKYPVKNFPFFEAMYAMDVVKKYTMTFINTFAMKEMILPMLGYVILPNKYKLRIITTALESYQKIADYSMKGIYLKKRYYDTCSLAIWEFAKMFITSFGIKEELANGIGKILATLIYYDDAYRYRFEDAMTDFNQDEWVKNPRKALLKFAKIFEQRDKQVGFKFLSIVKICRFIFIVPSIKKAFIQAMVLTKFSDFQLDEGDTYHCYLRTGYDFFGLTDEERISLWHHIHGQNIPEQIFIKTQ